jgi:hypothetical protein
LGFGSRHSWIAAIFLKGRKTAEESFWFLACYGFGDGGLRSSTALYLERAFLLDTSMGDLTSHSVSSSITISFAGPYGTTAFIPARNGPGWWIPWSGSFCLRIRMAVMSLSIIQFALARRRDSV